jgi:hypothetical protein
MKPIPEAIVNHFANFNPTPDDIKSVVALIEQIQKDPSIGTEIPFSQPKYKDCYVAFTADGKWQVVYRAVPGNEPVIVSVDPSEE